MHGDLEYHYSYCLYIRKLPLVVPCLQGMIIIDAVDCYFRSLLMLE